VIELESIGNPSQLISVCNIAITKYSKSQDGYTQYYINPVQTSQAVFNALQSTLNLDYWKISLVNNTVYISKLGASTFNSRITIPAGYANIKQPNNAQWEVIYTPSTDYIVIKRIDKADFTIRATDSWGNEALIGIKGAVEAFTDLPSQVPEGTIVEISGSESNDFDSYFVKYVEGIWKEIVKPGSQLKLDSTTLPHKITRTGVNEFTVSSIEWDEKKVGDDDSAPNPSFIDRTLNDIFFFKNRLGFLSGDAIILSKSGSYYDFYPTTATDVLEDDPIDVSVSTNQVSILKNALPSYNANLLIDAGNQQFIMASGDNVFSPKTVTIEPVTSFITDTKCQPVSAGANAYFVVPDGNFSHIREYFIQPETLINDAADITAHTPRYIPRNIVQMVTNSINDLIVTLSSDDRKTLYVYKYFWNGNEKIQ
jgi:hypothetical protein